MHKAGFVAYYRVSTARQGKSGLGLEAQRMAVEGFLKGNSGRLVNEFTEVESGKVNTRPKLAEALSLCRRSGAKLVIAKLDRLSRNAAFLLTLRDSSVEFVCCDMPQADRFTVGILALVAERERDMISARTKAALAAAKARGTVLGNPRLRPGTNTQVAREAKAAAKERWLSDIYLVVQNARQLGGSLGAAADILNTRGERTRRGGKWTPIAVKRVLDSGQHPVKVVLQRSS